MKRAHPYLVQTSLGAAQAMAKVGVEFVPMPITSADDHIELADQMVKRLQQLAHSNDVAHGKCAGLAAAVTADATASIDEELLAAVAILRNQGLSNLAQAVATAHDERNAAVPAPLMVQLPDMYNGKYWKSYPGEEGQCFEQGTYLADVRSALEAQGLQVKP